MQKKKIRQNVRFLISQGGKLLIADFTSTLQTDPTTPDDKPGDLAPAKLREKTRCYSLSRSYL